MTQIGGQPLSTFLQDATHLTKAQFSKKNGHFFLVLQEGLHQNDVSEKNLSQNDSTTGSIVFLAFPLQRKPDSQMRFISIGRTANNDVVLADRSISKFHAFFPRADRAAVQDGGSYNGTFVNGEKVPERSAGPAVQLKDGDLLKMGVLSLTFFEVDGFLALLKQLHSPSI